jgi:molybdopterin-guanine dinucleotide biosynthesis protein A
MKSGVILAGGRNVRMRSDKSTTLFNGKPLILHSYTVLKEVVDDILISVSKDRDLTDLKGIFTGDVRFVEDENPGLGPISGIYSSFKRAGGEHVAVAPCDSPYFKPNLYSKLFELVKGTDGAVPFVNGYWEPLHAVYDREAMLTAIEKAMAKGQHKTTDLFASMNVRKVDESVIREFDRNLLSFINLNTEKDMDNALNAP